MQAEFKVYIENPTSASSGTLEIGNVCSAFHVWQHLVLKQNQN